MRSITWFDTIAGNQRTWSRASARSSVTWLGAPTMHFSCDGSRHAESFWTVPGDPHRDRRELGPHPLELQILVVPVDLSPVHELVDHRERLLEVRDLHRLPADVANGRVAAADTHHHPSVGEVVQGGVGAREHGRVPRRGIRDEMAEPDLRRLASSDSEGRDRLLPEDVRVVRPCVLEAMALGELDELEPARPRRIREDGDAEADHGC
jgi:hypothetical protein